MKIEQHQSQLPPHENKFHRGNAETPEPLRSAGNLPPNLAPTKDNMRLRIADLERENAELRADLAASERRWLSLAQGVKQL